MNVFNGAQDSVTRLSGKLLLLQKLKLIETNSCNIE